MRAGEQFNPRNMFGGLFIPGALAASTLISSTGKLAYGHLVRRAGDNGSCWPSAGDVAKHIGVGERAAQRALRELQRFDPPLIRAIFRKDKNGRQTSNEYVFIWGPILEGVKNDTPVKNDRVEGVKTDGEEGVKNDTRSLTEGSLTEGSKSAAPTSSSNRGAHTDPAGSDDDTALAYIAAVKAQWEQVADLACNRWTKANEQIAREQFQKGTSLDEMKRAVLWGSLMRYKHCRNTGTSGKIVSLAYHVGCLENDEFKATSANQLKEMLYRCRRDLATQEHVA